MVMRPRGGARRDRISQAAGQMNGAGQLQRAPGGFGPDFTGRRSAARSSKRPSRWASPHPPQPRGIQIGYTPHGSLFDAVARANTILVDWSKATSGVTRACYFKQRLKAGEIGSSTMQQGQPDRLRERRKVICSGPTRCCAISVLPISRWQRDSDRSDCPSNMGVALGYYAVLAYQSLG